MKTLLAPLIVALFAPPPKDANEQKDIYGVWKIVRKDSLTQPMTEQDIDLSTIPRYFIISKDSILNVISPDDEKPVVKAILKRDIKLQRLTLQWDGQTQADEPTYELNEAKDKLILRWTDRKESNNKGTTTTLELNRAKRK
jgi:hypothetical protein